MIRCPPLIVAWLAAIVVAAPVGCRDDEDDALVPPPAATAAPATRPTPAASGLPTIDVAIGSRRFTLEVADEEPERRTGLMYRDAMPADGGMLFAFDEADFLSFWMKNTRIPLDILFLDATGQVVSVRHMRPYDLTATPSGAKAKYAIELNAGTAAKIGVGVGDRIAVPGVDNVP